MMSTSLHAPGDWVDVHPVVKKPPKKGEKGGERGKRGKKSMMSTSLHAPGDWVDVHPVVKDVDGAAGPNLCQISESGQQMETTGSDESAPR